MLGATVGRIPALFRTVGVIAGLLSLSRNLGLITGASVMGAVFAAATGHDVMTAPAPALAAGMRTTFAVAAVLIVIAMAAGFRVSVMLPLKRDAPRASRLRRRRSGA